ncbi:phage minor capsid protein [Loigolactobacillus bifermentans]|uniref:Minor capsid protein n=1 Tax=Loigolactobacillus bifermentans DSM 20003 TaxID=1423726 RepID=A0A0R1GJZ2_9LACO|nr:phage minor capsid protein [Loigolactobacillus bifermentans]KRK34389.1 minor capsid protein [Loigolactobacillus bifermentans DSM 20003]QGG60093.1 hypothetical protein LB003_06310 [Loigolactobacillus bifermentans]
MTLSPLDLDKLSVEYTYLYADIADMIFRHMVDQLQDINEIDDDDFEGWRTGKIVAANQLREYAQRVLAKVGHGSDAKLKQNLSKATLDNAEQSEEWLKQLAKTGKLNNPASLKEDRAVRQIVSDQQKELERYMAMARRNMTQNQYEMMMDIVNRAEVAARGGQSYIDAAVKAADEYAEQGLPALVDRAGKHWSPDVYMRTVINSQVNQSANAVELARMSSYGSLVRISQHVGARPHCAPYQGRVYSMDGSKNSGDYPPFSDTSYGDPAGILGINCKHYLIPTVDGVGGPDPIPDDEHNTFVYRQTQEQRRLERNIRAAKREDYVANHIGGDRKATRTTVLNAQAQMRDFIGRSGMPREYSREQISKGLAQQRTRITINQDSQQRHIKGTKQYEERLKQDLAKGRNKGPSYLNSDVNLDQLQKVIYQQADPSKITGQFQFVDAGGPIGYYKDVEGNLVETTRLKIHHSNKGAHIVPAPPGVPKKRK